MKSCLIIGGGLLGMLTARELANAGVDVTLIERVATGQEASWAGGGILSPLYPWRYPESVTALAQWSQQQYPGFASELLQETGVDPEWTRNGLVVLDTEEGRPASEWSLRNKATLERLDQQGLKIVAPELDNPNLTAGLWMPDIAQIRNPRFVQALKQSLLMKGVSIIEHCEVTAIQSASGKVTGVATSKGDISADCVVVAGGAWSASLLEGLELHVDVQPVRGQMLLFKAEPGVVSRIILYKDHYIIPRQDGRVLAGSTLEYVGYDKSTTGQAREELEQAALAMVPALGQYPIEKHWAGLRPGTPDSIPIIGKHPHIQGVFINTGHFRNGVVLGPASARLLADIMLGRGPILDPKPYTVGYNEVAQ